MSCVYISWGDSHSLSCCLMRPREKFEMTRGSDGTLAASRKGTYTDSEARPGGVQALDDRWSYILLRSRLWEELLWWDQKAEAQVWEARLLFGVTVKGPSQTRLLPQELPELLLQGVGCFHSFYLLFLLWFNASFKKLSCQKCGSGAEEATK